MLALLAPVLAKAALSFGLEKLATWFTSYMHDKKVVKETEQAIEGKQAEKALEVEHAEDVAEKAAPHSGAQLVDSLRHHDF